MNDDTTPHDAVTRRDPALFTAVKRAWSTTEQARKRYEAAIVTRDALVTQAMQNGFTSKEIAEAVGTKGVYLRNLLHQRRKRNAGG